MEGVKAVKAVVAEAGLPVTKVYKRRWVILILYLLVLLFNAVPWMQYTVLADVVSAYYGVSYEMIEWTALVYNVTATVLIVPAAWMLEKYDLRPSVLVGALLTAVGLWLRVLGCWPEHWWAVIAGHTIVSMATNFVVSAPPRMAAVWFPANEVSSAVGASIVGQMGGVSIGCLLAPLTARASWTQEENFRGFLALNLALAVGATILLVAVYFVFTQAPPLPPSPAQAAASAVSTSGNYFKSIRAIMKQPSFVLLLISFNLILSVYVAITTVLNRDIIEFFPERAAETGYLATLLCLTGMVATMVFGVILDKTKKFKELSIIAYFGGLASIVMYSVCIATSSMEVLYVVAAIVGIFLTSYFVPAYELAVELTYPEPEGNPTSILNWSMQPCSLVATIAYSRTFSAWGPHAAHGLLVLLMAVGFLSALFIPKRYLRREAELALAKDAAAGLDRPLMKDAKS